MKTAEKKHLAKNLFIKSSMTRKDIAAQVGTTEKTLRSWIDKESWEDIKTSQTVTRAQLLQEEYAQLKAINKIIEEEHKGVPNKQLSDAKGVIRKNIEALSHTPLYKYIEAFDDYINWLIKNHPAKVQEHAALTYEFVEELAKTQN